MPKKSNSLPSIEMDLGVPVTPPAEQPAAPKPPKPAPVAPPAEAPPLQSAIGNRQSAMGEVPPLAEYDHHGVRWRVEHFDLMAAEFALRAAELPEFHAVVADTNCGSAASARAWLIVRRLFGLSPAVPSLSEDADNLRTWSRDELINQMGLTRAQLQHELDAVRGWWNGRAKALPGSPPAPRPSTETNPRGELRFVDDEILQKYAFPDSIFMVKERSSAETREEKVWFARRVAEWTKALEHPTAKAEARQALLAELQIHRFEAVLLREPIGSKLYKQYFEQSAELTTQYSELLERVDKLAPFLGAVAGKLRMKGLVSDWVEFYEEYYKNPSNVLVDGVFTSAEVELLMRRSVQAPEPQYRADLVVFLNSAKSGLFDPKWKPQFKPSALKVVQQSWIATAIAESEKQGIHMPDLEQDGPEGEFEELG